MRIALCAALAISLLGFTAGQAQETAKSQVQTSIKPEFAHKIPNIPGKSLKTVLVTYAPGDRSPAHTHAKSAYILAYVLEGAIVSAVNGGASITYKAGEYWTEVPGDRHGVSANASQTEPARLLAIFVVDDNDGPLTVPDVQH